MFKTYFKSKHKTSRQHDSNLVKKICTSAWESIEDCTHRERDGDRHRETDFPG